MSSSREDNRRYRGRRRAPAPPRNRYAAVVTTAAIGAGVVAFGIQFAVPNGTIDPSDLAAVSDKQADVSNRQAQANAADGRASRSSPDAQINSALDEAASHLWLLPLEAQYKESEPFGPSGRVIRQGCELAAPEGTPFLASHDGTVVLARFNGALGYSITLDLGNDVKVVYGHAGKLLVHEGQKVRAGDVIGRVSDTGMAWGPSLYFAIEVKGEPVDPEAYLLPFGLDFKTGSNTATP